MGVRPPTVFKSAHNRVTRPCAVCGIRLNPFTEDTLTAHELECFKKDPKKVPEHLWQKFEEALRWQRRSVIAKLAAQKRGADKRRTHKVQPGVLLEEKNGWKLYKDREVVDRTRSGRHTIRRPRYVIVHPDGKETFYGAMPKDLVMARHQFETWANK